MAGNRHLWTPKEDELLVGCLLKLVEEGSLAIENGFRPHLFKKIEKMIEEKGDGCRIKASPDIVCRVKGMKEDWRMIHEITHNQQNLGFQWDVKQKCIIAEEDVWANYIQVNKIAAKFRGKSFPHFDALNMVFNKDKIGEEGPRIYNEVVNELEMLYDEVLKVEGLTDEERQQAYIKLIRDNELQMTFSHVPLDAKKNMLINLFH